MTITNEWDLKIRGCGVLAIASDKQAAWWVIKEMIQRGAVPTVTREESMDMLKQALCNELRASLERWVAMNETLSRNGIVSQSEHRALQVKIQDLEYQLDLLEKQTVRGGHGR